MDEGFIKLYRKFFNHWTWQEKRKLSRAEAWLWLLSNARYKEEKVSCIIKNKSLTYGRGEMLYSQDTLATKWCWVRSSVNKFLKLLEKDGMIILKSEVVTTRIIICNYEKHNNLPKKQETVLEHVWKRLENTFGNDLEMVLEMVLETGSSSQTSDTEDSGNGLKNGSGNGLETKRERNENGIGNDDATHKKKVKKEKKVKKVISSPAELVDKTTVHYKIRLKLESYNLKHWKEEYYWTPADAKNCTSLIKKLKFRLKNQKKKETDEAILNSFDNLLLYLPDWHKEHLSMLNINSKFNEIVVSMQKKMKQTKIKNTKTISYEE